MFIGFLALFNSLLGRRNEAAVQSQEEILKRALADSFGLSTFISGALGTEAKLNRSERFGVVSLSICLEHREATLLLAAHGARSSAFAMMRPVFESCVRGCWFGFVANDQQLDLLVKGKLSTKLEAMARAVEKAEPALRLVTVLASRYKERLDDFTHGTGAQLARWYSPEVVAPRHSTDEVIDVLRFIDTVGLVACAAREKLCGRPTEPFLSKLQQATSPARKGNGTVRQDAA